MGDQLGVAVVGTGFGILTHARGLAAAGFDVSYLVGRDPERTAERAARFGIRHATTTFAEALGDPDVHAVALATPPHTHSRPSSGGRRARSCSGVPSATA